MHVHLLGISKVLDEISDYGPITVISVTLVPQQKESLGIQFNPYGSVPSALLLCSPDK